MSNRFERSRTCSLDVVFSARPRLSFILCVNIASPDLLPPWDDEASCAAICTGDHVRNLMRLETSRSTRCVPQESAGKNGAGRVLFPLRAIRLHTGLPSSPSHNAGNHLCLSFSLLLIFPNLIESTCRALLPPPLFLFFFSCVQSESSKSRRIRCLTCLISTSDQNSKAFQQHTGVRTTVRFPKPKSLAGSGVRFRLSLSY